MYTIIAMFCGFMPGNIMEDIIRIWCSASYGATSPSPLSDQGVSDGAEDTNDGAHDREPPPIAGAPRVEC